MYNKYKSNEECIIVHIKLMNNVFYCYSSITNSHALPSGSSFILIRQFLNGIIHWSSFHWLNTWDLVEPCTGCCRMAIWLDSDLISLSSKVLCPAVSLTFWCGQGVGIGMLYFFTTLWIVSVILRNPLPALVGKQMVFHCWFRNDDVSYPLVILQHQILNSFRNHYICWSLMQ